MYIKETIKNHGYTLSAVAREIGVSQSALSQSIASNPTASTLIKIASVIGCNPGEFFMDGTQCGASLLCPHCGKPIHVKLKTE